MRLTVVLTHPIQYYSPWFRYIAANRPEIALSVVYATNPRPEQQGVGFERPFEWDVPLLDGYESIVVRAPRSDDRIGSDHLFGVDAQEIGDAVVATNPDLVLVPGWHSIAFLRAIRACRRRGIPVLYRGDTHLGVAPGGMLGSLWHAKTKRLLRQFDGYLSVGLRASAYLRYFGVDPRRIAVAPHSVDNEFFAASAAPYLEAAARRRARREFGLPEDADVVLFVGKLEIKKRPLSLVDATARVRRHRDVHLLMVGTGPREPLVREAADRLGVPVAWAGFLNQTALGRAYAVADCLALPSDPGETWGLVVNEAMATGLPAVVSDRVGCAPDLVVHGLTGEVFRIDDPDALAKSLERVLAAGGRRTMAPACRSRVAAHSFAAMTDGVVEVCRQVTALATQTRSRGSQPRVLACCGGMVIVGGAERMTFEVLRVLRAHDVAVHCVVNGWENHRITPLADRIGATWSIGFYGYDLQRRAVGPAKAARMLYDVVRTSFGLLNDAWRFRPTHILIPEITSAVRNLPALALLRLLGIPVVFRLANAPAAGPFYRTLWGRIIARVVSQFAPNSEFSAERLRLVGVGDDHITTIHNAVSVRAIGEDVDAEVVALAGRRRTLVVLGQIAPFKGTHLAIDAVLRLIAEGHDVQLLVVGHLPSWPPDLVEYARDLRKRVTAAGADDRIQFVGGRENVAAIMRESFLLLAPIPQEETFGNVVLEAASVGLPAVAFVSGGLPELIEHERTGYLCARCDVDSLVAGIRWFLDDPVRRNDVARAALERFQQPDSPFSRAVFTRKWLRMFDVRSEDAA